MANSSDNSAILTLPYIQPSQAQKHVTHNAALAVLDVLVQLSVVSFGVTTPPVDPVEGETYALGSSPTGAWAGQEDTLATWQDGLWVFITPLTGWRAYGVSEGELRIWDGAGWSLLVAEQDNLDGLGINTTHDTTNRLAVRAEATLLTHDGAGHQLKVNKATTTDTASLLFQSGFTGHAEMGLSGNTDFAIKVSDDGSTWNTALQIDAATGKVSGLAAEFTDLTGSGDLNIDSGTLFVDVSTNRVGVGTTSPAARLSVNGELRGGRNAHQYISLTGGASSNKITGVSGSGNGKPLVIEADILSNELHMKTIASQSIRFYPNDSLAMTIENGGNVVISRGSVVIPANKYFVGDGGVNSGSTTVKGVTLGSSSTSGGLSMQGLAASSGTTPITRHYHGTDQTYRATLGGSISADGSFSSGGADYAEYFEWADGNPKAEDRRGLAVVLDGAKIRAAKAGETPIGVISGNPSVIGDGDMDRWKGKYLRDDYGTYIWESYEAVEWTDVVTENNDEGKPIAREVLRSFAEDAVPTELTVPRDAIRATQQRRMLNPAHDPNRAYTPREGRAEWDTVGLMGKLRLRKGQPVDPRWIKMRDVSDTVEEWLVR